MVVRRPARVEVATAKQPVTPWSPARAAETATPPTIFLGGAPSRPRRGRTGQETCSTLVAPHGNEHAPDALASPGECYNPGS